MNAKVLTSLSAALLVTSFVSRAVAEQPIGTGYSARAGEKSLNMTSNDKSHTPASLDWTATIGTGRAASFRSSVPDTIARSPAAAARWTSRIGSGHPFDSPSAVGSAVVAKTL